MLAIPDEHLLKFHACKDAKSLWEAIKNRFGGNKESKKMQKTILKQNYENFTASSQEGLDKTYDSMDDLYNNMKVYESEIKGKSSSSSNSQNVAFVSSDNSSSTRMKTFKTAHGFLLPSYKDQASTASYVDDIDADDLEEMDLKWQVAMLTMRVKRAPRNQGNRNGDAPRRNAPVDTSTTNALVVQDGGGYQMGLESLEARIVVHEKNEAVYEEDIAFLKYDVQIKDISIKELKNQLENALKEKDDLKLKLEKFETSSKNLTKLINSQITAKDKTGLGFDEQVNESEVLDNMFDSHESDRDDNLVNDRFKKVDGYHAVPPPYTGNYMPSRPDLSFAGLDEYVFQSAVRKTTTSVPETETSISKTSKDIVEKPKTVRPSAPIIEEWDTDNDRRVTGQREIKPVWNNAQRVNHQNKLTHPHPKRNYVPIAVATKLGQVPVNAVKQSSPRVATSISTARPVNIVAPKPKVNDALPTTYSYFKAHSPLVLLREMGKMLLSPQHAGFRDQQEMLLTITPKDSGSYMLKRFDYADLQGRLNGCTGHMTRNRSFLTDYQEIDGGFVAFGGSPKGGKITRKCKIRTGKLDFEDVYFVKELKFNLFSVSQMCDKKNSVLFTETECHILSIDFKLLDESQVLL
ncbi:hypothetical protein Tco_1100670 [Tanacetum coccineum]